jgi:hypothetical protein
MRARHDIRHDDFYEAGFCFFSVMAGLVPAIHVMPLPECVTTRSAARAYFLSNAFSSKAMKAAIMAR